MSQMFRSIALLLLATFCAYSHAAFANDADQCVSLSAFGPPGALFVSKAQIIGNASERATLYKSVPDSKTASTSAGYILPGDTVEHVADCAGYSYVRFHGKSRTTTGWVAANRLKLMGDPYVPLPKGAEELCVAAQSLVNSDHAAGVAKLSSIPAEKDQGVNINIDLDPELRDGGGNAIAATSISVDGKRFAAIDYSNGGSCSSDSIYIWNSDLKNRLSPADTLRA